MNAPRPNTLEKMTITPASRQGQGRRTTYQDSNDRVFEVMFNPNEYTLTYRNTPRRQRTQTPQSRDIEHGGQETQTFQIKLILDGTGTSGVAGSANTSGTASQPVKERVRRFLETCYQVNGERHTPNHLHLQWGMINFYGWLQSVQIKYSLFDQTGDPLRAELDCQFMGYEEQHMVELSSPDLTHVRVVKAGDTLPLLAKEIYGSSRYYLLIAGANGLDDIRNLNPGTVLHFPPLAPV